MYILDQIKQDISKEIGKLLDVEITPADFFPVPQAELGDLSLPCFNVAKKLGKNPNEVAQELVATLSKVKWLESASATGPYVNIKLSTDATKEVLSEIAKKKESYGENKNGGKKKVMLEYSNANTHKEYHVGHLRNIAYGDAVNRILASNGWETIPVSYINDFGIHVAKTLWWINHQENKKASAQEIENKGYFLGTQYSQATKKLEENTEAKIEVGEIMKKIESRQGEIYKQWQETRQWSINQFDQIYKELKVSFRKIYYESDFIEEGLRMVEELRSKKILIDSQDAVIADLEQYNLGVLLFLRSDGTALYPVADLALAVAKVKEFKLDESLYIIDIRQSLHFNQLFKVLELMGVKAGFYHLGYDFVKLPSGMMSSRTGNVVTYDELRKQALTKTTVEIEKRHANWSKEKIEETAKVLAFGALKFEMLKVSANKPITFDMDSALRFDGFTSAYLQYTYARIQSIFRKKPSGLPKADLNHLVQPKEKTLAMRLANFPEAVVEAGSKKDPAEIAKYLFDLCKITNDYYHEVPVLKAEDEKDVTARLALLEAVTIVIKKGLELLGIETVEEM